MHMYLTKYMIRDAEFDHLTLALKNLVVYGAIAYICPTYHKTFILFLRMYCILAC